jgi:uncharacterized protein DUF5317
LAAILLVAGVLGFATGDRRLRTDRAPLHRWGIFVVAAWIEVLPLLPPFHGVSWASALARGCTIGGFALVLLGFGFSRRTAGVLVMALGVALNLSVIVANRGQMPIEQSAASRAGDTSYYLSLTKPGAHRHVQALPSTLLRPLDDRLPSPLGHVVSVGDLILALGAAWWLLAVLGSFLVPTRNLSSVRSRELRAKRA